MARLGVSKKKKSPRATQPSQLKKELKRVTEELESCKRELAEGIERETATGEILRVIASSLAHDSKSVFASSVTPLKLLAASERRRLIS